MILFVAWNNRSIQRKKNGTIGNRNHWVRNPNNHSPKLINKNKPPHQRGSCRIALQYLPFIGMINGDSRFPHTLLSVIATAHRSCMSSVSSSDQPRLTKRPLFYWILRRHHGLQLILLVIIMASLFFRVFPLEMQKRIINEAIYLKKVELLFLYCGLYMGAILLAGLSKYAINVLQTIIGQKILVELRTELYHHVLQLPLQFYRKMQPGTVISAMTAELNAIGSFLGGAITIPLTSILSLLVFLGFMYHLSPLLAMLSVAVYPFELAVIPLLQNRYNRYNKKRITTTRAMSNVVNEAISGLHEIHANGSYAIEEKRLSTYIYILYGHLKRLFIIKYGIKFANNLFQSIGPFILFLVGGYLAIHGEFTLGALVAFLSAYEKVYDPWKEMLEYYQSFQDAKVRYNQIMSIFDYKIEHPLLPDKRSPHQLQGKIELKNAGFSVDNGLKLLDNITMSIQPNEQVALVGFSGSGKSTLALLIAQLYNINHGLILLDDMDISAMSKSDINRNITMIAQRPFIFTGTIRENLLYAVRAAGDQEQHIPEQKDILQIIHDVGLTEDILRFGFNAVIPEERVKPIKASILRMRQIINSELREPFSKVVEPYNINGFMSYASLKNNLLFGESLTEKYALDNLPYSKDFRAFLLKNKLEKPLLKLGLNVAQTTVDLLRDLGDDDFFFQGSPMEPHELEEFITLLAAAQGHMPQKKSGLDRLLHLALRFIPAKHKITTMSDSLKDQILTARHDFLKNTIQLDMDACSRSTQLLKQDGAIIALPAYEQQRDFIPYCPSEYLYSHSLRDNILFGASKQQLRDHQDLLELAMEAFDREGLVDEVLDLGLDFEVGSQGDRLSGGQKQKLALARAFLKESSILIMDEATASLDNTSQAQIQNLLEKKYRGKKTIIAVIHRLDLTPGYDRIFVLKGGSLIEQGTYDELMAKQGTFYELTQAH